jgi:ABC-type bacteriocin/lantibiotic exporter with double-glycine peptidase domain
MFLGFYFALGVKPSGVLSLKFPKKDNIKVDIDSTYILPASYFEKQPKNQCAGYSAAYLLRFFGEDITGDAAYKKMAYKMKNGYVLPQSILALLKDYGYDAKYLKGDIDTLKAQVSQGTPVIVLVGEGAAWQHYITIVGYTKGTLYIYDSNYATDNSKGYNREMTNADFEKIWQNSIPLFEKSYFVASKV